jgi:tRNA (guanine-N7-)-methyltransferase
MRPTYRSLQSFVYSRRGGLPLPWDEYFGRSGPVYLEIGFGNAEYLCRQADQYPDRNFVGIEERWASVRRGLRRVSQAQVPNIRILQEDARVALERAFEPRSLAHILNLFPCPWHKDRCEKHRLFSTRFLRAANNRLRDGGEFLLVTDYRPLLDWTREQVPEQGFDAEFSRIAAGFNTKYERKWRAKGQAQFYQLLLKKTAHLDIPEKGEVSVETLRVPHFEADRFEPPSIRGDITVASKSFLFDPKRLVAMLRVVIVEENFTQNLWIRIARQGDGWTIQPSVGCGYVPTLGVQQAVQAVHDAIRGQEPSS